MKITPEEEKVITQQAKLILDEWWQTQHPRPVASYIGVLQIVKRCLHAGYEADQIRYALDNTLALTVNAIEFVLRKNRVEEKVAAGGPSVPLVGSGAAMYCDECGVRGGRHRFDCQSA